MNTIRRIALVGALAGAFGAGAATASGTTFEARVTPHLEACLLVREAQARGIDARARLPLAWHRCIQLGRWTPRLP